MPNKLENALKNMSDMDSVEADRHTGEPRYVHFFSTSEDKKYPGRATITLMIEGDSLTIATSRALPVNGWKAHADAIQRATMFLLLSGMSDRSAP